MPGGTARKGRPCSAGAEENSMYEFFKIDDRILRAAEAAEQEAAYRAILKRQKDR